MCLHHSAFDPWKAQWPHAMFFKPALKDQRQSRELDSRNLGTEKMMIQAPGNFLGLQGKRPLSDRGKTATDFLDLSHDSSILHYMEGSGTMWCWHWPWTLTQLSQVERKMGRVGGEAHTDRWSSFGHTSLVYFMCRPYFSQSIKQSTKHLSRIYYTDQTHPKWSLFFHKLRVCVLLFLKKKKNNLLSHLLWYIFLHSYLPK